MNGIERFEDLDKIISVVCRPTPSLVVKHIVTLKRKTPNNPAFSGKTEEERGYVFTYNFQNVNGMYLECRGSICLEGHKNSMDNSGAIMQKKLSCMIDLKDIANFLNRLDIAYTWLIGEENQKVYMSDSQGRPCKILDMRKVVVSLSQSAYVAFKPCIVRDTSDVTYEGIAMGGEQGEITNFTASEFDSFRVQMHALLPNLYMANIAVINNAIQIFMYNKLLSNKDPSMQRYSFMSELKLEDRILQDIINKTQFTSPYVDLNNKNEWLKSYKGEILIPGNVYRIQNEFCVYAGDFKSKEDVPKVFCCYTIGDLLKIRHIEVNLDLQNELPLKERRRRTDDDRPIDTTIKDTDNTLMILIKSALQYKNITRGDFKRYYPNISEMNNILRCIEKGENLSWPRFMDLIDKIGVCYTLSIDDNDDIPIIEAWSWANQHIAPYRGPRQ
jgi:hypothetical protein